MKKALPQRLISDRVNKALSTIGVVVINGIQSNGKNQLARQFANSEYDLAIQGQLNSLLLEIKKDNPIFDGQYPRLIKDWQIVYQVWDEARIRVDECSFNGAYLSVGLYILTSNRQTDYTKITHSGAGRILELELKTLTFAEVFDNAQVSLSDLVNKKAVTIDGRTKISQRQINEQLIRGGWVGQNSSQQIYNDLIKTLINEEHLQAKKLNDILSLIIISKNLSKVKQFVKAWKTTKTTFKKYLQALKNHYLVFVLSNCADDFKEKIVYWNDPSLLAIQFNVIDQKQFLIRPDVQALMFKNQVIKDLIAYGQVLEGSRPIYYQDQFGLTIDLIIKCFDNKNNYKALCFKIVNDKSEIAKVTEDLVKFRTNVKRLDYDLFESEKILIIVTNFDKNSNYYDQVNQVYVLSSTKIKP